MDLQNAIGEDRVREATPDRFNDDIDQETRDNIRRYSNADAATINERIDELDDEWDIERTLELNAALIAFAGIVLGATVSKKWLFLPAVVTGFLAQHAIQGWCPPLPLFRKLGIRTQKEIQAEKHALLERLEQPKTSGSF